jgi:hypothetical protein
MSLNFSFLPLTEMLIAYNDHTFVGLESESSLRLGRV